MDAGLGIGSAANLVGGIMQSIAAAKAREAMGKAFDKEIQLQQGYRNKAFNEFQPGTEQRGVEVAREQIQQGSQRRQNFYNANNNPLSVGASNATSRDKAAFQMSGQLRGQLGGYSDWGLHQFINNLKTQNAINKISNFAGGDASVFPYKMYDAQHSMDELAAWGNLISSIGGGAQGWGQLFGLGPQQAQQGGGGYGMRGGTSPYGYMDFQ